MLLAAAKKSQIATIKQGSQKMLSETPIFVSHNFVNPIISSLEPPLHEIQRI